LAIRALTRQVSHLHLFYLVIHLCFFWALIDAAMSGLRRSAIVLCVVCYLVRYFGLAIGYHRYFAHRSFKTSRVFQFLLALLGSTSAQRGVLWWAQTHRYHHRHSDTAEDIHSPHHQGFLYSHSGWFLDPAHRDTDAGKVPDLAKYPELVWLDRYNYLPLYAVVLVLCLFWGWDGFLWGFCASTVLVWHTTHLIQSVSHSVGGYKRFETGDESRNHWLLGVVAWGDGFHNNHHHSPSSARHGLTWWEFDLGYLAIKCFNALGLVWDVHPPYRDAERPVQHLEQT
jgi:stearoyl-CoA desaturase (delta-9 desaturase)